MSTLGSGQIMFHQESDQRQQQDDDEQRLHEVLNAMFRIDQEISNYCSIVSGSNEMYRTLRQDLETLALHGGYLNLLHKPLR